MRKTLIPAYRSLEFKLLENMFRLLTDYREERLNASLPLITRFEISQYYLSFLQQQDGIDPEVIAALAKNKKKILFDNLFYLNHAAKLLKQLKENDIECMVLKGLSFINHLYEDIGLRSFCDLDLLIHREDVRGFIAFAEEHGFYLKCEVEDPGNTDDFDIYNEQTKLKVDILTTLTGGYYFNRYFNLDLSQIWERKKALKIQETETSRLSEEDELLYAIVHMAFHLNFHVEIKWLFDLWYLLEKYEDLLDRSYLSERVRTAGLENVIFAVTELMQWMFEKDYSAIFGDIKPRSLLFNKTWLRFYAFPPRLFGTSLEFPGVVNRMAITFMKYALIGTPKKKWKFVTDRVFPDFNRIKFAYTKKYGIPLKFYYPIIYMLFLCLSPLFLTSLLAIFLTGTIYIKIILLKHRFLNG
ncbi:MAG: nucleotidyltransferase family protein [Bacteroidales bacterium]|nr:nucleotidyltransferase family protein [Bacteroidales bacterium]